MSTRSILNSFTVTLGIGLSLMWSLPLPAQAAYDAVRATQIVRQGYCQFLKRPAQEADLTNYGGQLTRDTTAKGFVYVLVDSDEYQQKNYKESEPRAWVAILYKNLLNRTASSQELRGWEQEVRRGGAGGVVNAIMNSPEYMSKWGEDKVPGKGSTKC